MGKISDDHLKLLYSGGCNAAVSDKLLREAKEHTARFNKLRRIGLICKQRMQGTNDKLHYGKQMVASLFATFWFKNPGSDSLAPVFSIFLVESTIVESNGLIRILRPFSFIFSLIFIVSLLFWKKD